jgi:phage terminase small subunit
MGQELAVTNTRKYDGRAMSALTDQQRQFVINVVQLGAKPRVAQRAAKEAGFSPNHGYTLMRDEGVLAAIREEATKKLAGAALVGVKVLIDIAHDTEHKDRFRAAKELAAINGFTAEQRIVVEHISPDSKGMIQEIRSMAAQLGLDPKQLISAAGIIEAEFTELPEDTEMDPVEDGDGE